MASVITPIIDIVEAQRFRTDIATIVALTHLQRVYDFERELRENSELTWYKVELMYHYFALRASQVILVVIETFLDLKVESREVTLSLGALGAAKG